MWLFIIFILAIVLHLFLKEKIEKINRCPKCKVNFVWHEKFITGQNYRYCDQCGYREEVTL